MVVTLHFTRIKITSFKHKALRLFWETGNKRKLPADQVNKIRLLLDTINVVTIVPEYFYPFKNWRIHQLSGNYDGFWSLTVKENWRIIFKFDGNNCYDIDYVDYH